MKKKKIFSTFTVECAIKIKERKSDKRETNKSKLELGKGTRADTLGIHLIFRPRDRKEQVVLRDVDASKTLVILETGANYSSSSPPHTLCVPIPATVHDFPPTSTCSFHPSTPTSTPADHPILSLSFFFLSLCRFPSEVTASNDHTQDSDSVSHSPLGINMNATSFWLGDRARRLKL